MWGTILEREGHYVAHVMIACENKFWFPPLAQVASLNIGRVCDLGLMFRGFCSSHLLRGHVLRRPRDCRRVIPPRTCYLAGKAKVTDLDLRPADKLRQIPDLMQCWPHHAKHALGHDQAQGCGL